MATECGEEIETLDPPLLLVGVQMARLSWKTVWQFPQHVNYTTRRSHAKVCN